MAGCRLTQDLRHHFQHLTCRFVQTPAAPRRVFPGDPFVPGAYVADWMVTLARQLVSGRCVIERCAFIHKVDPKSVIEIDVELDRDGYARARVIVAAQVATTAKLRFTSEPPCRAGGG